MTNINESRDVRPVTVEAEMKRSYLDYAMSVIVSRALPDVRDGLKPVHRRILFSMKDSGNEYNRPYRKSARTVGDVMGKYHPHGDMAIYDALVRLAQDFSLRVPLIDGQGNFGSVDGDPPAASRYTEARLSKAAHLLLEDIEKQTVDFGPNYDESMQEPKVLPARFPNILVNGGSGIAVGMATNIPTHNLGELIDGCCALIDNPELTIEQLMQYIPGPDFPTGGIIMGRAGILSAFRTGRGSIVIRGKTHIEKIRGEREAIIITEIPFQVNKARMIERIAEAAKEKIIEGISDLRDESDRDGMRVVIELKRDAISEVVLNQLYRHSPLQNSFGVNMLALRHGRPEQLNLKEILAAFLEFREEVIVRRTRFTLSKARDRAHLMIGLGIAVTNIDKVINLIKTASDQQNAKERLIAEFWPAKDMAALILLVDDPTNILQEDGTYRLTEAQAKGILDLRLHRLTGLEREKIAAELNDLNLEISDLLDILSSRPRVLDIMRDELQQVKQDYPEERRTSIEEGDSTVDMEDLIQPEDMVVTVSHEGYIKRVPLSTYRAQRRGGKGRSGMTTREEDIVSDVFVANTHSPVLFFSSKGKVYQLKVYRLPLASPQAKGRPMINLLPLDKGEVISTVMVLPQDMQTCENMHIMFATSQGNIRRNMLSDFLNIKSNGKIAMKLEDDENLISVKVCNEDDDVMMATLQGKAIRFPVNKIRVFAGRASNGVRGIRLAPQDEAISMTILKHGDATAEEKVAYLRQASKARQILQELNNQEVDDISVDVDEENLTEAILANIPDLTPERFKELAENEQFILTITQNGYGKRTSSYEYRVTGRGGQGVKNIVVNKRNGGVVSSFPLNSNDQIMLVTNTGKIIRCPISDIRIAGRSTQGVIVFRIEEGEEVVAVSRIPMDDESQDQEPFEDLAQDTEDSITLEPTN